MIEFQYEAHMTPASFRVLLDARLLDYDGPLVPARTHKKNRIAKKWLKRYGYRRHPDPNIYVFEKNQIVMHPAIFKKFERAIGTPEGATEAIIKTMTEGQPCG